MRATQLEGISALTTVGGTSQVQSPSLFGPLCQLGPLCEQ
jgi:hypothetical protein